MKEIDFLPEWYLEGKRRRVHMRRQYVALTIVFLGMMAYNLTSAHRISRATAEVAKLESRRVQAEKATERYGAITRELSQYQAKADLLDKVDSRIDPAALVAEISHLIGGNIVLNRVEFLSEPVQGNEAASKSTSTAVRAVNPPATAAGAAKLGDVKFRIILAGIAAGSDDVGALVCRLEESSYFRQAHFSFSRNNTIRVAPAAGADGGSPDGAKQALQVSEFEITCYLANFEEIKKG